MSDPEPTLVELDRGGVLVETRIGPIQFGYPPETIKDTMVRPSGVPQVFVAPKTLFCVDRGISFADIEFPVYFNFFANRRPVLAIVRPGQREELIHVLREALFGPEEIELREDFPADAALPDLRREMDYFRLNELAMSGRLELEDVIEFRTVDADTPVDLGEGVEIALDAAGDYEVRQDDKTIARVPSELSPPPAPPEVHTSRDPFVPPFFGLTVLGRGHGFDPAEKTTGFILWVGGKGILVDPPVDSTEWLKTHEISPKLMEGVLLTHCHGDHDAGCLQKVLEEGRTTLFTTPLIHRSFLTKYRSLTGLSREGLARLVDFQPLTIGRPITILGGEFLFRYTFHSIPAIGFELFYHGRSFCYSGDTLNDPASIERAHSMGYMDDARREELLEFPWNHDIIFHEAGVPPIHTPIEAIARQPRNVRRKVFLVHITPSRMPEDVDLRVAEEGVQATLRFKNKPSQREHDVAILDVMSQCKLFQQLPFDRCRDLLAAVTEETYGAGETFIHAGARGEKFYIIMSGKAAVWRDDREFKIYSRGDYIGETALILDQPRNADVRAKTELTLLALRRDDFLDAIRGTQVVLTCRRLARNRELGAWEVVQESPILRGLSTTQKTELQSILRHDTFPEGFVLAGAREVPDFALIVATGTVKTPEGEVGRGAMVPDFAKVARGEPYLEEIRAISQVTGFSISRRKLSAFLDENPGLDLRFRGAGKDG